MLPAASQCLLGPIVGAESLRLQQDLLLPERLVDAHEYFIISVAQTHFGCDYIARFPVDDGMQIVSAEVTVPPLG